MQKKKVLILQFMLEKMAIDYIKQALKFCNRIEHRFYCHNDINVLKELSNKKIPRASVFEDGPWNFLILKI